VPHLVGVLGQRHAVDLAPSGAVEDAQLDALGMRREQREIGAAAVPRGAQRIR
jgi:hypothetical protein